MLRQLPCLIGTIAMSLLCCRSNAIAQVKPVADTTVVSGGLLPFNKLIPDSSQTQTGLFTFHKAAGRYYMQVPDSMLERPFLLVSRISKGSANGQSDITGHAGDMMNKAEVLFRRGPDNKIFLILLDVFNRATDSSENGMWRSLENNNLQAIIWSFLVKTFAKPSSPVIDITDFLSGDNSILTFNNLSKVALSIGAFHPDKSYIAGIRSFPANAEIRTVKTYTRAGNIPSTYEFNLSVVMLPVKAMRSRAGDKRIGYFESNHREFDKNPQSVETKGMITRWRLEPAPADIPKYLNGELVEPVKPIVFYIDPSTPKKWVPWLIKGVNDWQKAFEKAGFKNAIYALEAPVNDSTWSLEDARHNAIVYKPSETMNASGPHVNDPRSGEILESHINWYHNVMALLQEWYFVQTAAVDPQARLYPLPDSLMGKLIRFVCTHEVGHTLGLRHNLGASTAYPVDSLRNIPWLKKNGHTPSIMDYARFNYVAQPEDRIPQDLLIPRIGIYDEWAIEYGYRWFPPMPEEVEADKVRQWLTETLGADKRLWYGTEEMSVDSRCLSEDLGDDPAIAGEYGIRNLKVTMKHLIEWTAQGDKDEVYGEHLKSMEAGIIKQYTRYLNHAAEQIGGEYVTFKTRQQAGAVIGFVQREKQKEALAFINNELFVTPRWLMNPAIFKLIGGGGDVFRIAGIQKKVLDKLLSYSTYSFMVFHEENDPADAYTFTDLLSDLDQMIWKEIKTRQPIDAVRRSLQKRYVERLAELVNIPKSQKPGQIYSSDFISLTKFQLKQLEKRIGLIKNTYPDKPGRLHLEDIAERLKEVLHNRISGE